MKLSAKIKLLRQSNNMSQAEFGKRVGRSQGCIAHIEKGASPDFPTLIRICKTFKVSINTLVHDDVNFMPHERLMEENRQLKQQLSDLRKMISLLEKKRA